MSVDWGSLTPPISQSEWGLIPHAIALKLQRFIDTVVTENNRLKERNRHGKELINLEKELYLSLTEARNHRGSINGALIMAIEKNRMFRLKFLLKRLHPADIWGAEDSCDVRFANDPYHSCNLLIKAMFHKRREMFDLLCAIPGFPLDKPDCRDRIPFMEATLGHAEYYGLKLISLGANLDEYMKTCLYVSPLHKTIVNGLLKLAVAIIENSNFLDFQPVRSKQTALIFSCQLESLEGVCLLLTHNADVHLQNNNGLTAFDVAVERNLEDIQEVLFDYVFTEDQATPLRLVTLVRMMKDGSSILDKIFEAVSILTYTSADLDELCDKLSFFNPTVFQKFFDKYSGTHSEIFTRPKIFEYLVHNAFVFRGKAFDKLCYILESHFVSYYVESMYVRNTRIFNIIKVFKRNDQSLSTLTNYVCLLLSQGAPLYNDDVDAIYFNFGYCELFKICLHMDIIILYKSVPHRNRVRMPALIYDINMDLETYLRRSPSDDHSPQFLMDMLKLFAHPKLQDKCFESKEFCSDPDKLKYLQKTSNVPSLLELTRDAVRKHIIDVYEVTDNVQFYSVLKGLPIPDNFKEIISYEWPLY